MQQEACVFQTAACRAASYGALCVHGLRTLSKSSEMSSGSWIRCYDPRARGLFKQRWRSVQRVPYTTVSLSLPTCSTGTFSWHPAASGAYIHMMQAYSTMCMHIGKYTTDSYGRIHRGWQHAEMTAELSQCRVHNHMHGWPWSGAVRVFEFGGCTCGKLF